MKTKQIEPENSTKKLKKIESPQDYFPDTIFKKTIIDAYIFDIIKNHHTGITAEDLTTLILEILLNEYKNILPIGNHFVRNRLTKLTRKRLLFRQKSINYNTNPPYLYFLEEPPLIEDFCQDCNHCIINETIREYEKFDKPQHIRYCLLFRKQVPRKHSCPHFEENQDYHKLFSSFAYEGHSRYNKIFCPHCKSINSLKIPRYDPAVKCERVSICNVCRSQIRRTKNGMYVLVKRRTFHDAHIEIDDDGYWYVPTRKLFKYIEMDQYLDCRDVFNVVENKNGMQIATVYKKPNIIGWLTKDYYPICLNCVEEEEKLIFDTILQGTKHAYECFRCKGTIQSKKLPKEYVRPTSCTKCFSDTIVQFNFYGGDFTDEGFITFMAFKQSNKRIVEEKPDNKLQKAMQECPEERKIALANQMVIAQATSYINSFKDDPLPKKRLHNKILKQLEKYKTECEATDLSIRQLQSREGNIHKATWKHDAEFLTKSDHSGRGRNRYSRSVITTKARGFTPFHCVLNHFYYLLVERTRSLFRQAQFNVFHEGIIHYRKDKKDGLLYDFVDLFRPIIRKLLIDWCYGLDLSFYTHEMLDENGRIIYHISDDNLNVIILNDKFRDWMKKNFSYATKKIPLSFIIFNEITKLKNFFLVENYILEPIWHL